MTYYLKSGLGKRKVYSLCKEFVGDRVSFPAMVDCDFKRCRNNYWLTFSGYELGVFVFAGNARICVSSKVWIECDARFQYTQLFHTYVPFEYLKNNDFLRSVA
ncbi:hypothetical protein [Lachnoclostridium sp. An14]|uniref:hypothetical protein n=1 Tax=Lachnoclostridium sp. An14 TaxID=1965562 RepID=UPI00117A7FCB|nr:hypothetical protein [Lachnoclostridium sp. An14]